MSAALPAYRSVVREVYRSSIHPRPLRNKAITSNFRAVLESYRSETGRPAFQQDIENVLTFMRSQRMHKILLERYNPLHDLTTEERVKATARRVGLDMPVKNNNDD
ncbi:hypothetical protein K474DRAFT_1589133 [Panus rudis PR-1116 ss-1]|nr:hypothetical protein K474DRAFT_1589133 [Panus rudis PR-1116 ss-1]